MKNTLSGLVTKSKVSNRLLLVLVVVSIVPQFFVSRTLFISIAQTNQKKEKKITKARFENEPIEFVELKSNGNKFKLDEKFTQEEDWLKDFTLSIKNVSGKPITHISLAITFPETQSTGLPMTHFINYGVPPNVSQKNNDKLKLLAPNETVQISLSEENYAGLKNFLATRNHSLKDLTQARLTIMLVDFEDGTKWSAGDMYRPDPNRPGKYIAIDETGGKHNEKK